MSEEVGAMCDELYRAAEAAKKGGVANVATVDHTCALAILMLRKQAAQIAELQKDLTDCRQLYRSQLDGTHEEHLQVGETLISDKTAELMRLHLTAALDYEDHRGFDDDKWRTSRMALQDAITQALKLFSHPPVPVAEPVEGPTIVYHPMPMPVGWRDSNPSSPTTGDLALPPALSEEFIAEAMRLVHECISLAIKAEIERGTKAAITNEDAEAEMLVTLEAHLRSKG